MALYKFLKGDSKRISTDITPFHEGWIYVTNDGYMYIDMNLGTKEEPNNQRVKLNAGDAETLFGASLSKIMNSSDGEIPTSKAVMDELKKYALASHTHNDVYYPKDEIDSKISTLNTKINKKSDTNHSHVIADVTNLQSSLDSKVPASRKINDKELTADIKLSASDVGAATSTHDHSGVYSPVGHNHNDKYYTETEVNTLLANKANTEDIPEKVSKLTNDSGYITKSVSNLENYYTTTDIDSKVTILNNSIEGKANVTHGHTIANVDNLQSTLDSKVPVTRTVNGKALSANISLSASDVGADVSGTASSAVSTHNTNTSAHNDIRLLITNLTNRLDTVANSTDKDLDQLSEIVAYIKSNKELIDAITTSKVSVSDIINNLTTNVSNKPLSAAQGVALKKLIDEIVVPTKVSELTNDSGYLTEHPDITVFDHAEDYGSSPTSYGQTITIVTNLTHDKNGHVTSWTENNIMLPTVDGALSDTSTKPVQNKVVTDALNDKPDLWVGTKEEYDALETTDENCFYAILDDYQDAGFENASNKVTTITSSSTDTQYPSAAAVYRTLQNISGYERTENRDNVISAGSTDNTYPSSLAVYTHTNNTVNSAKETILQTIEDRVYGVEKQSNKVIEITENAGHTTYPSAKAVYEAIQTYGGTDIETTNIIDENSTADEVPNAKAVHDFVVNHVPEIPDVSTMIPTVYTSTSEPTPSDGKVGDLWVVTD